MRIATMVRGYLPVPRPADIVYAPIDIAVTVAQGLAKRGHQIDFYAPEGSDPGVPTKTLGVQPFIHNQEEWLHHLATIKPHIHYLPWMWDLQFVRDMYERAAKGEYDVLLFHHPELALPLAKYYPSVITVSTLHDPLYDWYVDMFTMYRHANNHLISISDNQRRGRKDLAFAATVYNGIDTSLFAFSDKPGDYLLYTGRVVPEKGVAEAVQVARKTREQLVIIGTVFDSEQAYFDATIKPYLNDKIRYLGYLPREQLVNYYQQAKALLMPSQWDEPFGLTMIEAMACGTPVIGTKRGSIPEVVANGKTGFVVEGADGMVDAVKKLSTLNRQAARQHVEDNFSLDAMVTRYEAALQSLLK